MANRINRKIYLEYLWEYPEDLKYRLAKILGRQLLDYLGEDIFCLLLDADVLLGAHSIRTFDKSYKIHPAAKALEGFLRKMIKRKKLYQDSKDQIGDIFGEKQKTLRLKINDKKLIAKTKAVWDYCRNDIMHYAEDKNFNFVEIHKRYEDIIQIIQLIYQDFYGASVSDDEIEEGYALSITTRHKEIKYSIKARIIRFIREL